MAACLPSKRRAAARAIGAFWHRTKPTIVRPSAQRKLDFGFSDFFARATGVRLSQEKPGVDREPAGGPSGHRFGAAMVVDSLDF